MTAASAIEGRDEPQRLYVCAHPAASPRWSRFVRAEPPNACDRARVAIAPSPASDSDALEPAPTGFARAGTRRAGGLGPAHGAGKEARVPATRERGRFDARGSGSGEPQQPSRSRLRLKRRRGRGLRHLNGLIATAHGGKCSRQVCVRPAPAPAAYG